MRRPSLPYCLGVSSAVLALLLTSFNGTVQSSVQSPVVTFVASDHAFHGPDTIPGGTTVIRLRNHGREPHQLQLVWLANGRTPEELTSALQATQGRMPTWARYMGGPNGVESGGVAEAILYLEPGTYAVICLVPTKENQPHVAMGMQRSLLVGKAMSAPKELTGDIHIAMYDFEVVAVEPIERGAHTFSVINRGKQAHQISLVRLEHGNSSREILASFGATPAATPPGKLMGGIAGLEPGARGSFTAELAPGRYALMCLFPNPTSPESHAAKGMVLNFTVD